MKKFFKTFAATALLLAGGCGDDPADDNGKKPGDFTIALATEAVEIEAGATAAVRISITPADTKLKAEKFTLTTAEGKAPTHVALEGVRALSSGTFEMTIRDKGTAPKYTELLEVGYAGGKSCAQLTVRSVSYMPRVYVTTSVPQASITKDDWVDGKVRIDGGNLFPDLEEMATEVKGRGNSTWGWEKKPYALKLSKKQEVLGMPKHKRWCLIANYMDRTHLRNRVAYYIGQHSKLAYTVRNEFVEFWFNGKYEGLYLLTEQIKEDQNRVNITELESSADPVGSFGYLLEMDTNFDEAGRFKSTSTYIPVNIKYPDYEDMSTAQFNYIQDYVNRADAAFAALEKGQSGEDPFKYVDRESMIDFWIAFEIMANHEILHPKSIYFHKEKEGKLIAGPIWDFDYETLVIHTKTQWINYNLSYQYNEYPWYEQNWWNILLKKDAKFRADVKARWQEWYPFLKTVPDFIEQERKALVEAEKRNWERWPQINAGGMNRDETLSFNDAVARLSSIYTERMEWMNHQIAAW